MCRTDVKEWYIHTHNEMSKLVFRRRNPNQIAVRTRFEKAEIESDFFSWSFFCMRIHSDGRNREWKWCRSRNINVTDDDGAFDDDD